MSPNLISRAEELQSQVDAKISQLKEQIRELKTQRNSLAPIASFPVEVLTEVFSWLTRSVYHAHYSRRPGWITVTHVCRYWRQAALQDPSLWSQVPIHLPAGVIQTWLERSKHASIDFGNSRSPLEKNVDAVLAGNTERIRGLNISLIGSVRPPDQDVQVFKSTMPKLEFLEFTSYHGPIVDIPCEWTQLHAPQLRSLTLIYCRFDWSSLLLRARKLTTLSITKPGTLPNPNELVDLLGIIGGQLEVLELVHVLSSKDSPDPEALSPSTPRFSLPSLKMLSIEGHSIEREVAFVSLIESYGEANVNLDFSSKISGSRAVSHCNRYTISTIINVLACRRPPFEFEELTLASHNHGVSFRNPAFQVCVRDLHTDTSWMADLDNLPMSKLKSFTIATLNHYTEVPFSGSDIFLALSRLDELSEINLEKGTARSFLDHFTLSGLATDPTPFPALKCLVMGADLADFNVAAFQNVLKVRKANGHGLRELSFFGCENAPRGSTSRLNHVVDKYKKPASRSRARRR